MIAGIVAYMLFLAFVLAKWEIQIEGQSGWAKNLPCWRKNGLYEQITGKPLTGYHFWMVVFLLAIGHLPFLVSAWSIQLESLILGFLGGVLLVDDFLWFVLNPAYGLKNFKPGKVEWHKKWIGPVPDFYWPAAVIIVALYWCGAGAAM